MSLFARILIHLVVPQATADAESLDSVLDIIAKIKLLTNSDCESEDTGQAHLLIIALSKLANAAILKAGAVPWANKYP
jgi:hypothetical protein